MAVVRPLAGLRYDPARVGDVGQVLAPPYDVITPAEQAELHARSPHNVIRLILPREPDRGAAAARTLREWVDARILVPDPAPAMYLYSQRFSLPDGATRRRDGVLCRLRLEDFASGVVLPHERTLPGPKADRLAILRATGANLSAIFGLYARPREPVRELLGGASLGPPLIDVNGWHQLWRITDQAAIDRFVRALAAETIVIADGHHRYETALAFRDEQPGNEAARYVLAYLANVEDEGVVILPTHRLVRQPLRLAPDALEARLRETFAVERLESARRRAPGEIDAVLPGRRLRLRPLAGATDRLRDLPSVLRSLDVELLQRAILTPLLGLDAEALDFTHDDEEAADAVAAGRAAAAFLLNAPTIATVRDVCLAGEVMPEKSTYFYPKIATGLVLSLVGPPWV
ncbi:MAG TPA: DUF1015 domain-containing protein [Candidatus Binatus sp.]|nr:DUF1015 domain-containing protein [Candidatus Binatus sp.]